MRNFVVSSRVAVALGASLVVSAVACSSNLNPPTAAATAPPSAAVGASVALDGSASSDPNGLALSYAWRLAATPAGSKAKVEQAALAKPWFTPDVPGDYAVELVVSDGVLASAPVRSTVTVGLCGTNPPVVSALTATPAAPQLGENVQLAAKVTDPDTGAPCNLTDPVTLHWSLASVPAGSLATLSGATQDTPWFHVDVASDYVVNVFATDAQGHASDLSTMKVTAVAKGCGTAPPVGRLKGAAYGNCNNGPCSAGITPNPPSPPNATPPHYVINAGGFQDIQLDASASFDADAQCGVAETLSYQWSILAAPLNSQAQWSLGQGNQGQGVTSTLVNPTLNLDRRGRYQVQLVVSDGNLLSSPIVVQIDAP